jgi:hypothetical protein
VVPKKIDRWTGLGISVILVQCHAPQRRLHAMPRYLVIHHAPGVSQEDFQRSIPEVLRGKYAAFAQTYVNLTNGTIVNVYEAESEEAVGRELERVGFPYDEIQEIQFEASAGDLRKMTGGAA